MEIIKSKSNDPYCIKFPIITVTVTPELYQSVSAILLKKIYIYIYMHIYIYIYAHIHT